MHNFDRMIFCRIVWFHLDFCFNYEMRHKLYFCLKAFQFQTLLLNSGEPVVMSVKTSEMWYVLYLVRVGDFWHTFSFHLKQSQFDSFELNIFVCEVLLFLVSLYSPTSFFTFDLSWPPFSVYPAHSSGVFKSPCFPLLIPTS